jgi:hypothetical protein
MIGIVHVNNKNIIDFYNGLPSIIKKISLNYYNLIKIGNIVILK